MSFSFTVALSGTASYYTGNMVWKASSGARFTKSQTQLLFKTNKKAYFYVDGDFENPNPLT